MCATHIQSSQIYSCIYRWSIYVKLKCEKNSGILKCMSPSKQPHLTVVDNLCHSFKVIILGVKSKNLLYVAEAVRE